MFSLQGVQVLLLGLELGCQLHQLVSDGLQRFAGVGLGVARLLKCLFKVLLPLFGARVVAQQLLEALLACLLLFEQLSHAALQDLQRFRVGGLLILLTLDAAGAFSLLSLFIALLIQLFKAMGDLLIKLHKAG